jgi:hypothetical protein
MYLVKRCCDLTLQETATRFRVRSYGLVGWAAMECMRRWRQIEDLVGV